MPAAALPWVGAGLGALGLIQGAHAQKTQSDYLNKALGAQKYQQAATAQEYQLASNYNPHEEDKTAIAGANQNAAALLKQSLGNLNTSFLGAGGQPTGDTAFNISATNAGNRIIDPLKQFQAQLAATETQRKMAAFEPVLGAPAGQASNAYFNAAQYMQPNYGPSLQLFGQSLQKLFKQGQPATGIDSGFGVGSGVGGSLFGAMA